MPVSFVFKRVTKQNGKRCVREDVPLKEIMDYIRGTDPEGYAMMERDAARRYEIYVREAQEKGTSLINNGPDDPVNREMMRITDVGDVVYRNGKWNGKRFNDLMARCRVPTNKIGLYRDLLHDRFVYSAHA